MLILGALKTATRLSGNDEHFPRQAKNTVAYVLTEQDITGSPNALTQLCLASTTAKTHERQPRPPIEHIDSSSSRQHSPTVTCQPPLPRP